MANAFRSNPQASLDLDLRHPSHSQHRRSCRLTSPARHVLRSQVSSPVFFSFRYPYTLHICCTTSYVYAGYHTSAEAGPSQGGHDGTVSGPDYDDNIVFTMSDFETGDGPDDGAADVLGASQLGGAPPPMTQDTAYVTPPGPTHPARASRPASRLTYPEDHVRVKRGRGRRGG